ncbi:hypothetical protein ACIBJI_34825 [Nocardia sp. NPDC050408]|uniref:hypothetical protein n=1 Tax=Nocardia sp. NPDC050408 TaxID=3364319 RepID=UPI003789FAE4
MRWLSEHHSVDLAGSTVIVIIGLVVLVAAVMVGLAGVLANGGVNHALTDNFAVFGYHVTGSTGLLFLYGIVVGAAGLAGLSLLLAGARRTARRGRTARSELEVSRRETTAVSRDRDDLADRQSHLDEQRRRTTASPALGDTRDTRDTGTDGAARRDRFHLFGFGNRSGDRHAAGNPHSGRG